MSTDAKRFKETLNLPKTRFDMKANLTVKEPKLQERWRELDLYGEIRKARAERGGGCCTTGRLMPTARFTWGTF